VVGPQTRTRTALGILAVCLLGAGLLAGRGRHSTTPPAWAGPAPAGLSVRLDDEVTPRAGDLVSWRTFWALCWDPYAGAGFYELRVLTGEGTSARLVRQPDRCFRIEAAAGESLPGAQARDRSQQLAAQQGQLAIQVRAVVGGGRSDWSAPVAVGSQ
jgi:hypothetical protein